MEIEKLDYKKTFLSFSTPQNIRSFWEKSLYIILDSTKIKVSILFRLQATKCTDRQMASNERNMVFLYVCTETKKVDIIISSLI